MEGSPFEKHVEVFCGEDEYMNLTKTGAIHGEGVRGHKWD